MISFVKNNQTITPESKNVCILFGGTISIERNGKQQIIPSKTYFFFDTSFNIITASPFIDGFIIKLTPDFLSSFPEIKTGLEQLHSNFEFHTIKDIPQKKKQIQSLLHNKNNKPITNSYLHILWNELLNDYINSLQELSIVEQFSELIDQHIDQNYCAGTYAEMLGIPLKQLIREVKKDENKTPCNFITGKVIEKAKEKLLTTDDTSQMIAYQLGFEDPYYFIKYFKKNTLFTPTQFRAQFQ